MIFNNIFRTNTRSYLIIRRCYVKRKYPVNPSHADKLPTFDYVPKRKDWPRVYTWGFAQTGALGLLLKEEKFEMIKYPKRLTFAKRHKVVGVSAGFGFSTFIVDEDGANKLYATGMNTDSQIGYHELKHKKHIELLLLPQEVYFPTTGGEIVKILKVATGRAHTLVVTDNGLYTLGNNAYGQCGRNIVEDEQYNGSRYIHHIPTINGEKIIDVEAGQDHSLVITNGGKVYASGWGADGQTGLGHYNTISSFTRVRGDIEKEKIVKLSCMSDFVLALSDKGEVFGWGNIEYNQLETTDSQQCSHPTFINHCKSLGIIKDIAAGGTLCMVLDNYGVVHVWGYGLLGLGPKVMLSPKPLKIPPTLFGLNDFNPTARVENIACGLFHMAAVTNNGELYMWGRNKCGCLGIGDDKDQYFPYKIAIGGGFVNQVQCGADHTIAVCKPYG